MADAPVPPARPSASVITESPSPIAAAVQIAGEPAAILPPGAAPSVAQQAEFHPIHTTRFITEVIERPLPSPPAAPIAAHDMATQAPIEVSIAPRRDADPAIDRSPAMQPASIESIKPRREPLDATEPIDLTAALTPARRDLPPVLARDAAPPAPQPAKAPPSEERIVQVRIGAIEIHAPAPTPAPPAPAAVPMQRSLPRSGFDEFARLRSYAPWEW
jgi:hypothetical protein